MIVISWGRNAYTLQLQTSVRLTETPPFLNYKMVNSFSAFLRKGEPKNGEEKKNIENDKWTKDTGHTWYIVFLCVIWYGSSSGNNIVGKILLEQFRFPATVTMFQLTFLCVLAPLFVSTRPQESEKSPSKRYWMKFILPLAAGKFLSSFLSLVSIANIPVSFSSTGRYFLKVHSYCALANAKAK